MTRHTPADPPVLVLIDLQQGFDDPRWGTRNQPHLEDHVARLLAFWRSQAWPILHVQHCSTEEDSPLRPDREGCQFKSGNAPRPTEPVFSKNVNSAFIGTGLEQYLNDQGWNHLFVAGLTTDHCVSTTVRMAANLGFNVHLIADAVATFDRTGHQGNHYDAETIHQIHLASLNGEFCTLTNTTALIEELIKAPH